MNKKREYRVVTLTDVPEMPQEGVSMYVILPKNYSADFYNLRTDRELGNRTKDELDMIKTLIILHFGAGGMGGLMIITGHRSGASVVAVVDPGSFDATNSNRQAASNKKTEGKNKAFETVRMARDISDDTTYIIITESMTEALWEALAEHIDKPSLMYDEIELFEVEPRLTVHEIAKAGKIPVINCNTVLYRSYFFLFDYSDPKNRMDMTELLAASLGKEIAYVEDWRRRKQAGQSSKEEDLTMEKAMHRVLIPKVPEYSKKPEIMSTVRNWFSRINEGTVIVTATNPPGAASFAMSQGMLYLLNKYSSIKRRSAKHPRRGYFAIDFAMVKAWRVIGRWYQETSPLERWLTWILNWILNVLR